MNDNEKQGHVWVDLGAQTEPDPIIDALAARALERIVQGMVVMNENDSESGGTPMPARSTYTDHLKEKYDAMRGAYKVAVAERSAHGETLAVLRELLAWWDEIPLNDRMRHYGRILETVRAGRRILAAREGAPGGTTDTPSKGTE